MRRRPAMDRELDLGGIARDPRLEDLEVVEHVTSGPQPLRLFAGPSAPCEAPYARAADDRTGVASLWRAIASL